MGPLGPWALWALVPGPWPWALAPAILKKIKNEQELNFLLGAL